jgi:hypothetical protein
VAHALIKLCYVLCLLILLASPASLIAAGGTPTITDYAGEIISGEAFEVSGTSYADSEIAIIVRKKDKIILKETGMSDGDGKFTIGIDRNLSPGIYSLTAQVVDGSVIKSDESEPLTFVVKRSLMDWALLIGISIGVLAALSYIGNRMQGGVSGSAQRAKRESRETEKGVEKAFNQARRALRKHLIFLNKAGARRRLTEEEINFLKKFESELKMTKDFISQEIKDILKDK